MCQISQKGCVGFPLPVRTWMWWERASVLAWFESPILFLSLKLKVYNWFSIGKGENWWWNFSLFPFPFASLFIIPQPLSWKLEGWLISCPSRKRMLLLPQALPGLHVLKKSLKGLCGSLSSSCSLCLGGSCWPGPSGVGTCREGVFLSCKEGDNRKREERQHIYTLYWDHVCVSMSPTGLWPPRNTGLVLSWEPRTWLKASTMAQWMTIRWMDGYMLSFWFWRKLNCPAAELCHVSTLILTHSIHSQWDADGHTEEL